MQLIATDAEIAQLAAIEKIKLPGGFELVSISDSTKVVVQKPGPDGKPGVPITVQITVTP
jgi:hypothetical protein